METKKTTAQKGQCKMLKRKLKELKEKFEIEKRCKNRAYYFILSNGLLERFRAFEMYYKGDGHEDCKEYILGNLHTKQ